MAEKLNKSGFGTKYSPEQSFLKFLRDNPGAADYFKGMSSVGVLASRFAWKGNSYVPPGSPADIVVSAFKNHTNIPLELPFNGFLFFLSGYLLKNKVKFKFGNGLKSPFVFILLGAPSGSGKTFTIKRLKAGSPVIDNFPECASGAKFIEALANLKSAGEPAIWFQDEFGQKLKGIETEGHPLADAREYLLRAYDGDPIERVTKQESIRVEDSTMTILATNVDSTLFEILTPESLADGFCQRWSIVLAEKDPTRNFRDYPEYDEAAIEEQIKKAWEKIASIELHEQYEITDEARKLFHSEFRNFAIQCEELGLELPESFYRRILYRSATFAMLYHIILCKASNTLDAEDMTWAMRLTWSHLQDSATLLTIKAPKTSNLILKAQELKKEAKERGEKNQKRFVQQRLSALKKNPGQFDDLWKIVGQQTG